MNSLRLIGIAVDRERLARLAGKLELAGYSCALDLGEGEADLSLSEPASFNIICWTSNSVGPAGVTLQQRAAEVKEQNAYLGLLLDKVMPPESVRAAQDIDMAGWDETNQQAKLGPLLDALRERIDAGPRSVVDRLLLVPLRSVFQAIVRIERRLASVQKLAILSLLFAAFSLFSNIWGTQDVVCSVGLLKGPCRMFNLGNLPSDQEQTEWAMAWQGTDCKAFEAYLQKYGPTAPFANDARQRLALFREVEAPVRRTISLPLSVPWSNDIQPTIETARVDLDRRASLDAARHCSMSAQALAGEWARGRFEREGKLECDERDDGFACRARGFAQCSFLMPAQVRTCPGA